MTTNRLESPQRWRRDHEQWQQHASIMLNAARMPPTRDATASSGCRASITATSTTYRAGWGGDRSVGGWCSSCCALQLRTHTSPAGSLCQRPSLPHAGQPRHSTEVTRGEDARHINAQAAHINASALPALPVPPGSFQDYRAVPPSCGYILYSHTVVHTLYCRRYSTVHC